MLCYTLCSVDANVVQYGGSLENRARFVLELIAALKTAMPIDKYLLAVKFNCQDCKSIDVFHRHFQLISTKVVAGGTTFAEACIVMKWLEDAGVDFFDISGGVYEYPIWRGQSEEVDIKRPSQAYWGSYFLEWAEQMKRILVSITHFSVALLADAVLLDGSLGLQLAQQAGGGSPIVSGKLLRKIASTCAVSLGLSETSQKWWKRSCRLIVAKVGFDRKLYVSKDVGSVVKNVLGVGY